MIWVELWMKDRNPTSRILPQILPQELLRLRDLSTVFEVCDVGQGNLAISMLLA